MNPLPFHFSQAAFLTHHGVPRCSKTALSLWLMILEEGYCTSRLNWATVRRIGSRYSLDDTELTAAVSELLQQQVCRLDTSGSITPIEAGYLLPDFWVRIRTLNS